MDPSALSDIAPQCPVADPAELPLGRGRGGLSSWSSGRSGPASGMTKPASVSGAGLWWVDASGNTLSFPAETVKHSTNASSSDWER